MNLQEREKTKVALSPKASKARIIDLENKVKCWEGHIRIAEKNGDSLQKRIGESRIGIIERQIANYQNVPPRH